MTCAMLGLPLTSVLLTAIFFGSVLRTRRGAVSFRFRCLGAST
jgi:hypothetical protein